jgi:hypothetical protein
MIMLGSRGDQLPRKIADDCLVEYDGFTIDATPKKPAEIRRPGCFAGRKNTPDSAHWVEENIEETPTFYRLPRELC